MMQKNNWCLVGSTQKLRSAYMLFVCALTLSCISLSLLSAEAIDLCAEATGQAVVGAEKSVHASDTRVLESLSGKNVFVDGTSANVISIDGTFTNGTSVDGTSVDGESFDQKNITRAGFLNTTVVGTSVDGLFANGVSTDSTSLDGTSFDGTSFNKQNKNVTILADESLPILFRGDLSPADAVYTINRPGVYKLTSAKTASGVPNISIVANNVTLDLGGNVLTGGTNGIEIAGNNVTVKNGTITDMTGNGVLVQGTGCRIEDLAVAQCATGITLQSCNQCVLDKCSVRDAKQAGVSLVASFTNYVHGCSVTGVQNFGDAYGFIAANGGTNVFDSCSVNDVKTTANFVLDTAGWYGSTVGGFVLKGEVGSQVVGCAGTSVIGPADYTNQAYGIGMLPGLTLSGADSLLSVTQSPYAKLVVRSVAWLTQGEDIYLASGGAESPNRVKIHKFDVATSSLLSVTESSYAINDVYSVAWLTQGENIYLASGDTSMSNQIKIYKFDAATSSLFSVTEALYGANVMSVAWLTQGESTYLAVGGWDSPNRVKIYKFDAAMSSLLLETESSYVQAMVWSVAWFRQGESIYLASGSNGHPSEVAIYKFEAANSSLLPVTKILYGGNVLSVALLLQGESTYLAAGTQEAGKQVKIYKFDAATSSLFSVTHSSYGATVDSVAWLTQGENSYLAAGGSDTSFPIKLYMFDAATSSLLSVTQSSYVTDTVYSVASLAQGKDVYLASGSSESPHLVKIHKLNGFLQQESEHCLLRDNNVSSVHSTQRRLATVGVIPVGTGLYLSTTDQYVARNTAYDCDISFAGVSSKYITSPANARGAYNIDTKLTTPDQVEVAGDVVTASASMVDALAQAFFPITTLVNNRFACSYTPILTATTVTTPGTYCLARTINGGNLLVTGTGITLALNNRTINNGKLVISGDRVNVSNGLIRGTTSGSTISGVSLTGNNCKLSDLRTVNCLTGFELTGATKNTLDNCQALNSSREGFLLTNAQDNTLSDCKVTSVVGTGTIAGIKTTGGVGNEFVGCGVNQVQSTASGDAYGIVGYTESLSQFNRNIINDVSAAAGNAYGLMVDQDVWMSNVLSYTWAYYSTAAVQSVDWVAIKPGLAYLAASDRSAAGILRIFRYDGTATFNLCYSLNVPGPVWGVTWLQAYGNTYLAVSWSGIAGVDVRIYRFDITSETLLALPNASYTYASDAAEYPVQLDWLKLSDGRIFLAMVGNHATTVNKIQIASFDGSNLTWVTRITQGETGTYWDVDWLVTGTTIYLVAMNAITGTGLFDLAIYNFDLANNTLNRVAGRALTGQGESAGWLLYNNAIYVAVGTNAVEGSELTVFNYNTATNALTTVTTGPEVNSWVKAPEWLITGTNIYLAFGTYNTDMEVNVCRFDPLVPNLTLYYSIALPDASACYDLKWFTGTQGRALFAGGFAGNLSLKVFGFDLVGTTSSVVEDNIIANIDGTGIQVNQLSEGILNNKVSNASPAYRLYPGEYDISNKIVSNFPLQKT